MASKMRQGGTKIATATLRGIAATVFRKLRVVKLLFATLGILAGCLLTELCSYISLRACPSTGFVGRWEFRSSRPPPYQDADYFSADFLSASMRSVRLEVQSGTNLVVTGDFAGRFINVSQGRR